MSDSFFARWSRRKRAGTCADSPPREEAASTGDPAEGGTARSAVPHPPQAFDPASLPPLETITAATDIRPFLAAGVPPELTRAALRRAWIADPKIRNFVGPADYDWDFNSPGAIAPSGPIEVDVALRRELARLLSCVASEEIAAGRPAPSETPPKSPEQDPIREPSPAPQGSASLQLPDRDPSLRMETNPKVDPRESEEIEHFQQIGRRRHGGALPRSYQARTVP